MDNLKTWISKQIDIFKKIRNNIQGEEHYCITEKTLLTGRILQLQDILWKIEMGHFEENTNGDSDG